MKLSPFTYILFGICICIICLSYGFVVMKPNRDETASRRKNEEDAKTEYGKEGAAHKRVQNATKLVQKAVEDWNAIAATKTPPASLAGGGIDISVNGAQLMVDSRTFRDSIQTAVNKQLRVGNIKLVGDGPRILDPSQSAATILADFYNYPAIPFPVVIFDLGTITVEGTYEQIMANVRGWKDMPNYLAVADGLRIDGTSPHMTGTYAVSMVGYVHGSKLFTALPEVPGSSGAGGGGNGQMGAGKAAMGFGNRKRGAAPPGLGG